MAYLNLVFIRECTESEGPGKRFAIWCQGCLRQCKGCCNKGMQEIKEKYIVDTDDLSKYIIAAKEKYDIEGITLVGGEPVLQAEGFAALAEICHSVGLSVLLFTGFVYSDLINMKNPHVDKLLSYVDILVDGPYVEEEYDDERDWIGSKNQKVYFLTDRYKSGIEYEKHEHSMELLVSDKKCIINGWPFLRTDAE